MQTISTKTYSNKSNALRAAKKALTAEQFATCQALPVDGKFAYQFVAMVQVVANVAQASEEAGVEMVATKQATKPFIADMDVNLMYLHLQSAIDVTKPVATHIPSNTHTYICGYTYISNTAPKPTPLAPTRTTSKGLKIEKQRDEQNGIKRPSLGGKCRAVWDACDALYEGSNANPQRRLIPMPKAIKNWAEEAGFNPNNAVIELYQWRKFMGFSGRK